MSAELLALLDGLDAAREKATPGEWMNDSHEIYQEWPGIKGITGEWIGETCRPEGDPLYATSDADAALIVAAVNSLPKLTAALRAVLAYADELDTPATPSGLRALHGGGMVKWELHRRLAAAMTPEQADR